MSPIESLIAKDAIRDLVLCYSRAIDRKDMALLRDLYTADATDTHGSSFDGPAGAYCDFIEKSLPYMRYSGHHVCDHLISVDGECGEGEVYALAWHIIPDGKGGWTEDFMAVRYFDHYRKEHDGKWRFAKRVVTYDMHIKRPFDGEVDGRFDAGYPSSDASYAVLATRLFAQGKRA